MIRVKLQTALVIGAALLLPRAIAPLPVHAQTPDGVTLTVHVIHARNAKGTIRAALFPSSEGFPGDTSKALQVQSAQIDPRTLSSQIVFAGIRPGAYAVSVFHDENMNGRLDKNFVGIPKEGYGSSNNPAKKMRPPTFEEASFPLKSDQSVEITLIY